MQSPSPLSQAIVSGDDATVKRLIDAGFDVNSRSASGQTPLILAVASGQTHLIPLLIDAGAQPRLRDKLDLNAIDWAERKGLGEIKVLLEREDGSPLVPKVDRLPDSHEKRPDMFSSTSATPKNERKSEVDASEEKARKWISGLRARFEEQAQRQNFQSLLSQPELVPQTTDETAQPNRMAQTTETVVESAQAKPIIKSTNVVLDDLEPPKKNTRKRCPKCNAMYDSELLGYCAHHVVPLVDANLPIVSESQHEATSWLWLGLMIFLCASVVAGYYLLISRTGTVSTLSTAAASPAQFALTRKASAIPSAELAGKAKSLPDAECPLNENADKAVGTVTVKVRVDKSGRVFWTRSSGGDWLLRAAAMDAATKSTFLPEGLRSNSLEGSLTYNFKP